MRNVQHKIKIAEKQLNKAPRPRCYSWPPTEINAPNVFKCKSQDTWRQDDSQIESTLLPTNKHREACRLYIINIYNA